MLVVGDGRGGNTSFMNDAQGRGVIGFKEKARSLRAIPGQTLKKWAAYSLKL